LQFKISFEITGFGGFWLKSVTVLSTNDVKIDAIKIYPNPVKNELNIDLIQGLQLQKVNIYNTLGQFIISSKKSKIDTSNLTNSIYFVEVETDQGKSVKKIIVK